MQWHYPTFKKILDRDQDLAFALRKTAAAALASKLIRVVQSG